MQAETSLHDVTVNYHRNKSRKTEINTKINMCKLETTELTINDVAVTLEYIGEGLSGDYDPEDKDDIPLLRFTVLKDDEPVDDASYCTQVPTNISITEATKILGVIMNEVLDPVTQGHSIKKMCERLSLIDTNGNY